MDDLGSAIQSFLSQPGAMEQVQALAKQLGMDGQGGDDLPAPDGPPPELMNALSGMMNAGSGKAQELLEALRGVLRPEKQDKIDRAIRAVRLMGAAKLASKTLKL